MSKALGFGLSWLKATRINSSICCISAIAGFTVYYLVADQWISSRRQLIIRKRKASQVAEQQSDDDAATIATTAITTTTKSLYGSLYIGGRFVNPFDTWRDKTLWDFIYWLITRSSGNGIPNDPLELDKHLPLYKPHYKLLDALSSATTTRPPIPRRSSDDDNEDYLDIYAGEIPDISTIDKDKSISATWIGQSTCFIQMNGLNILTDPIFKQRTVYSWLGPERLRPVPCQLEDLPYPDIVLVSHNHFDHLDIDVVKKLGNNVTWYIPLGLRDWFVRQGVYKVKELDWWQESEFHHLDQKFIVACTPTQHWSGRNGLDSNTTLWSSFIVKSTTSNNSIFHCGDTGYCPVFKEIGAKYGPISLAILPIGSYKPRWYMCHQHINPEDAVLIHRELLARYSIGVHWGTFMMSDEHYLDPPRDLAVACDKFQLNPGEFVAPHFGKTLLYTL